MRNHYLAKSTTDSQITMLGNHQMPGLWKHYFPSKFLSLKFPQEQQATCMNCPEIKTSNFRPDYRCCTFQPKIFNFNLGSALTIGSKATQKTISEMIDKRWITPEGLIATPARWKLFLEDKENQLFGKSNQVLCEFLNKDTRYCNIYDYRNAPCSTFFCRHDHGQLGEQFWNSLMVYVNQIEHALSQWIMQNLGYKNQEYFGILDSQMTEYDWFNLQELGWPENIYNALWGSYLGREKEFLTECSNITLKHRKQLLSIADNVQIIDANKFESHIIKTIPNHLTNAVEDDDKVESEEKASLEMLFKLLMFDYRELYL